MYASKVLAALAVVGFAAAASSASASSTATATQCSQATATINSAADASSIADCTTFTGDIEVLAGVGTTVSLDNIQTLNGDLNITAVPLLTSISMGALTTITGTMTMIGLTVLTNIAMPVLKEVGTINFNTLPALQNLGFTDVVNTCSSVTIIDTQLSDLDGINLDTVGTFIVSSNRFLTTFSTQVANVTTLLDVDSNGEMLKVELPNLVWANSLTFRNTSSVTMQSLANVTDALTLSGNLFTEFTTPNLTTIGGTLTFAGNADLTNITMDALTIVGGILIANNTDLVNITGFNSLKTVSNALDITGNYTDAEFPALTRVGGAFHMVSSGDFSCTPFDKAHTAGNEYLGTYICTPTASDVQTGTGTTGGTSTGSASSASGTGKKSAAGMLDVPTSFGLVGGLLAMLL